MEGNARISPREYSCDVRGARFTLLPVYPQDDCYQFASSKLQNRLLEILPAFYTQNLANALHH